MLIAIIVMGIVIVVLGIVMAIMVVKGNKSSNKSDNVYTSKGVRYTKTSSEYKENGGVAITHREGDIILERGQVYKVAKGSYFMPGKYTMLSAGENAQKFNVRIGGVVREYSHATDIVLADGDEISAVSHTIILR